MRLQALHLLSEILRDQKSADLLPRAPNIARMLSAYNDMTRDIVLIVDGSNSMLAYKEVVVKYLTVVRRTPEIMGRYSTSICGRTTGCR
ncbi:MAG: hypothetical protein P4M11_04255 [Candidatus Pacebacteria bacterium]|nr:hypothetical protein [Candidatus Paceibacterota bacterium]